MNEKGNSGNKNTIFGGFGLLVMLHEQGPVVVVIVIRYSNKVNNK